MADAKMKLTEAEIAAMPPLCVAGCCWFQQSGKSEAEGVGICFHDPAPVKKYPGGFCSKFETLDQYKHRAKLQSLGPYPGGGAAAIEKLTT